MSWFNYYGLIAIVIILIPNIIATIIDKGAFENKYDNKVMLVSEQIGRYGCMVFMVFNIPYTFFDFWFDRALMVYLIVNGTLLIVYLLGWILFCKKRNKMVTLWLAITPTAIFLFSGIMLLSVPLIAFAVVFGIGHITISYMNSK